ncbi:MULTISPECIES: hypothetical protein [Thermoanaerobacter]|jgi:predicted DNA-binding protein|uniref:Ribbon-helix-helix protein CopG domain-containing protein n=2 Tax=Thermoanaerobacter TaxID=1754 RepID=B0KAV2_THEP3|nr:MULTISPECIES: hypothetical protein [Thermoanaerobacter]ABY93723.1 hypothetical protein Teth39_0050 [Thermoanaerobacter pseudethanolicus ATCC 33223]ADV78685.1 hypothetical protein Thebr_0053 [Thermoanaerobacter brockii subsp. finnii Ako-1]HBW59557.1 hypothetical protein [Thermoanaerobacter sp.]
MKKITVKVSDEIYSLLLDLSARRQETVSSIVRKILEKGLTQEAAESGIDAVTEAVRKAMRDVLRPTEDRLAKLMAKAAVAAATAMYMNVQTIADLGKHNAVEIYNEARVKAAAYLKERDDNE